MNVQAPVFPADARGTRHMHHRRLGPFPRILLLVATIVSIGCSIWTTASASADIGFNTGPMIPFFAAGLLLAWAPKPGAENDRRIACVWSANMVVSFQPAMEKKLPVPAA